MICVVCLPMFLLGSYYWEIRATKDKGRGVFARKAITLGVVIGDYVGELIKFTEVDYDKEKENMFLMYYNDTLGIYPDLSKPGVHLLNHSCYPNAFIYAYKNHTLVCAINDIKKDEEITISYLLPPKADCKNCSHNCRCGSKNCTNTMHLSEKKYMVWQNFQKHIVSKGKNKDEEKELKPLAKYPRHISNSYIDKIKSLGVIS